ncbi:hypothetical protein G5A70_05260 [Blautia hansenii]|uniref:Surfactant protein C N-terminal propeptide domain-containing protein n=1 Tax=Blautia hansenii TaxID=1322 RepID=A0ABX2I576_BLAHA|nr:hypothetical protein [Blautia hansenii]
MFRLSSHCSPFHSYSALQKKKLRFPEVPIPFKSLLFLVVLVFKVVVEVIVEILFKIFQIIRSKETVNSICDSGNGCNCTDNRQYPQYGIFIFFFLFFLQCGN